MLVKVISGGQTGVDQAALRAAKSVGIKTGGWMPANCRTLDGPNWDLLSQFDMQMCSSGGYPKRTLLNVQEGDGTLCLARDFSSPGEKLTKLYCDEQFKPRLGVDMYAYKMSSRYTQSEFVGMAEKWIRLRSIRVLNVAGNSEQTAPGIGEEAYGFLCALFSRLKGG